jgi:hypothetical protein
MVAGKPAWHKLGVNVAEAVSSKDALRLAGLDWQVKKQPLRRMHHLGSRMTGCAGSCNFVWTIHGRVSIQSLTPGDTPRLGPTRSEGWLRRSVR